MNRRLLAIVAALLVLVASCSGKPNLGTRENPLPPGETVRLDNWSVTVQETNVDAWEEISRADSRAKPPDAGNVFLLVAADFTYHGEGSDESGRLMFDFVTGSGTVLESWQSDCGFIDMAGMHNAPELFTGASDSKLECLQVPADEVDGGVWRVKEFIPAFDKKSPEAFIALS